MSLDVDLIVHDPDTQESRTVFTSNITHNLNAMAAEVPIDDHTLYEYLWRPEEIGVETAEQLIYPLVSGLGKLLSDPERYEQFNPANGWGSYNILTEFIETYILACIRYPAAKVKTYR